MKNEKKSLDTAVTSLPDEYKQKLDAFLGIQIPLKVTSGVSYMSLMHVIIIIFYQKLN